MSLRVGVGLDRMGSDAEAARRRAVDDFGFGLGGSSGGDERRSVKARRKDGVGRRAAFAATSDRHCQQRGVVAMVCRR